MVEPVHANGALLGPAPPIAAILHAAAPREAALIVQDPVLDLARLAARLADRAALVADRPLDALLPRIEPSLGAPIVLAAGAEGSAPAMTAAALTTAADLGMTAPAAACLDLTVAAAMTLGMTAAAALGVAATLAMAAAISLREDWRGDAKGRDAGEKQKFTHVDSPNPIGSTVARSERSGARASLYPAAAATSRPKVKLK